MDERQIAKLWEQATAAEQRGDLGGASRLYRAVAEAAPGHAPTFQRMGLIALRQGQPEDAEASFRRALAIEPGDAVCLNNLGNVLREQGKLAEALASYEQALDLDAGYVNALYNLAGTLTLLGRHHRAAEVYRELVVREPRDPEAWSALGLALLDSGAEEDAREALRRALELAPGNAEILNALGVVEQYRGNLDEARRLYRASIESDPTYARGYDNLVRSRRMSEEDLALAAPLERMAGDSSGDPESRLIAHFALGKLYEDRGEHDSAFRHYERGNALVRERARFDAAGHGAWVDRIIATFTEAFFRDHSREGSATTRPVFVVGMIRSGTTLVEQILASHSRVHGAGELIAIPDLVSALPGQLGVDSPYPECVRSLDAASIGQVAAGYLQELEALDDRALRVVDKMPTNFLHLGLIATVLPNASIVHCRREPLDVCLSIYFQRFAQGHLYAYDFRDIAAYYADYERLMRHWEEVLPVKVLSLSYERLLDDPEGESRRLLAYCGLEWEDACLAFHESTRPVRTASSWQVRQPLYKTSRTRWRKFEAHLDALKEALDERGVVPGDSVSTPPSP